MDCSSLRAYLKSELPNYDATADNAHESLANAILGYFSHKGMEMTPDDAETIREYGEDPSDYFDFDENQVEQIGAVMDAAQNLIDVLCNVPDYLKNTFEQDGKPPHAMLIAEAVANMLGQDMAYIFFPVREEGVDGTMYISDIHV